MFWDVNQSINQPSFRRRRSAEKWNYKMIHIHLLKKTQTLELHWLFGLNKGQWQLGLKLRGDTQSFLTSVLLSLSPCLGGARCLKQLLKSVASLTWQTCSATLSPFLSALETTHFFHCSAHRWLSSPDHVCGFEDERICGFSQDRSDNFDWTRQNHLTQNPKRSPNTGPETDRSGTKEGRPPPRCRFLPLPDAFAPTVFCRLVFRLLHVHGGIAAASSGRQSASALAALQRDLCQGSQGLRQSPVLCLLLLPHEGQTHW